MFQWIRNSEGILVKASIPQSDSELSLNLNLMEPPPEEQQSQQRVKRNPNAYRSMSDYIHPPRMSAPSCIVPPIEQMVIRPHFVPLLPIFHGMESENPYSHIREFEEVCTTFKEETTPMDLMRLELFTITLKDKEKIWLKSLRTRIIQNWTDMQVEFLKKFFPTHRINSLKRQLGKIYGSAQCLPSPWF